MYVQVAEQGLAVRLVYRTGFALFGAFEGCFSDIGCRGARCKKCGDKGAFYYNCNYFHS
jgi:hypothetical protein